MCLERAVSLQFSLILLIPFTTIDSDFSGRHYVICLQGGSSLLKATEKLKLQQQKEEMAAEDRARLKKEREEAQEAKRRDREDKERLKEEQRRRFEEEKQRRREEKERRKLEKEKVSQLCNQSLIKPLTVNHPLLIIDWLLSFQEREKLKEEKKKYAERMKLWNKPREDMECEDLKVSEGIKLLSVVLCRSRS